MCKSSAIDTEIATCKEPAMSGDREQHVDTNNELGLELKKEVDPVSKILFKEPSTPLFISDSSEGNKGNAQDEKDETAE